MLSLVLAIGTIAIFRVAAHLVSLWLPDEFTVSSSGAPGPLDWVEAACMATAVAFAVVALVMGRGRLYAIAAIVLAVLGTGLVIQVMIALLSGSSVTVDVH